MDLTQWTNMFQNNHISLEQNFVDFVDVNLEKFIEEMYIVQLLTNLSKMYISTFNI